MSILFQTWKLHTQDYLIFQYFKSQLFKPSLCKGSIKPKRKTLLKPIFLDIFSKGAFFSKRAFHWVALFVHVRHDITWDVHPALSLAAGLLRSDWPRSVGRQISNAFASGAFSPNSLTIVLPLKRLRCYCDTDTSQRTHEEYSIDFIF